MTVAHRHKLLTELHDLAVAAGMDVPAVDKLVSRAYNEAYDEAYGVGFNDGYEDGRFNCE